MAMQFQGWVSINGQTVPATQCGLDKKTDPIIPETIWGSGWKINYARGRNTYAGDVTFPMFKNFITPLKSLVVSARDTAVNVIVDDSLNQFTYGTCKVAQARLSSDKTGPVQCSLTFNALSRTASGHVAGTGWTSNTTQATNTEIPFPGFSSAFTAFGIDRSNIIDWELNITNNPFLLYTLNGSQDPSDIQLGHLDVSGSFSYYLNSASGFGWQSGVISDTHEDSGALVDQDNSCGSLALDGNALWTFGAGVIKDASRALDGPNNKPIRKVQFQLLGTATQAPLY